MLNKEVSGYCVCRFPKFCNKEKENCIYKCAGIRGRTLKQDVTLLLSLMGMNDKTEDK